MRAELIRKWVRDMLITVIGLGGLCNEVFIQEELNWGTASFCMVILLVPGAFALASLRQNGESNEPGDGTTTSGSSSPQPSSPSSPSSSSSSA